MTSSVPQSPTRTRPGSRDTGFPEPFCGQRNTTLPHPDADLSPDACITGDDISLARVLSRTRRSFLTKHRRAISHGIITESEQIFTSMEHMLARHGHQHSSSLSRLGDSAASPTDEIDEETGGLIVDHPINLARGPPTSQPRPTAAAAPGDSTSTLKHGSELGGSGGGGPGRPSKDGNDSLGRTDTDASAAGDDSPQASMQRIVDPSAAGKRRSMLSRFGIGKS